MVVILQMQPNNRERDNIESLAGDIVLGLYLLLLCPFACWLVLRKLQLGENSHGDLFLLLSSFVNFMEISAEQLFFKAVETKSIKS